MEEISPEEEKKKKEEEEAKKKEEEEKKKREEEEEREREREKTPQTTSSLSFIIDGLSCFEPFEIEIVSSLDTLLNFILHPEKRMNFKEREREGERMCFRIIPLLLHILSLEEEERWRWLIGFGPMGIVKNVENEFVIVYHEGLIERENGKERFKPEIGRWKSNEILSRDEEKETEKSLVFTISSILYSVLMEKKIFDSDCDKVANGKIVMGEREDLKELEAKKSMFVSIMKECWSSDPSSRMNLIELRNRIGDAGCNDDFDGEEDGEGYGKNGEEEKRREVSFHIPHHSHHHTPHPLFCLTVRLNLVGDKDLDSMILSLSQQIYTSSLLILSSLLFLQLLFYHLQLHHSLHQIFFSPLK
jgi:hypothetical protein